MVTDTITTTRRKAPLGEGVKTIIHPSRGWVKLDLSELWQYRELLYFLAWRSIKVRYKQTLIGAGWAVIHPVLAMVVFSVFFGRLVGIQSEGLPYPVFAFAALVPWTYFSNALRDAASAVVEHQRLITRVYFPRLILPVSAVLSGLIDCAISVAVLLAIAFGYKIKLTLAVLTLPLFLALATLTALGVGLWLSAFNALYRDVRHALPFLIQLWLFATPVVYPSSIVPDPWRILYGLNPMVGVIEGFRWALFEHVQASGSLLVVSILVAVVNLLFGLYYFRRMERTFADLV